MRMLAVGNVGCGSNGDCCYNAGRGGEKVGCGKDVGCGNSVAYGYIGELW